MTQLRKLAGACDDIETCPAVYVEESGIIIAQGEEVEDDSRGQLNLGPKETAVRLPAELILEAARKLAETT